jgi:anti-sigma regulatory factor (Ser/Thr protein kinase)
MRPRPGVDLPELGVTAQLNLRSDPSEFRRLVSFAEGFGCSRNLPSGERARLLIILEELFTNVIKHSYDNVTRSGRIEVALAFDGERIEIEFSDDGRPFDPLSASLSNLDLPAAQREIGGLGLQILRSLTDDAKYTRRGDRNYLTLIRNITRPE